MVGVAEREKLVGRKPKEYRTKNMRIDERTHNIINGLAGLYQCDVPDFCNEHLRPLLEKMYRDKVEELHKEISGKKKGK